MPFGLFKTPSTIVVDKKKIGKGTIGYHLKQSLKASLGSGISMRDAVKLPPHESKEDWLAMNTVEIYNNTLLCFRFVSEFCTVDSCPKMTAGPKYTFLWEDKKNYSKPTEVSANEYIELLMQWVRETIEDENQFPQKGGFPKNFIANVKNIWKRLARVYFHIYYHHWDKIIAIEAEAHVNTCFKHFYFFASEFELLDAKALEPVGELTKKIDSLAKSIE